jgi:hypothetical protein
VKSVFARHHVERVRDLGVAVSVGVRLPRNKVRRVYPIPEDIVHIVPEYRGYEYIMLEDGRVLIIDPDTYEVVDNCGVMLMLKVSAKLPAIRR